MGGSQTVCTPHRAPLRPQFPQETLSGERVKGFPDNPDLYNTKIYYECFHGIVQGYTMNIEYVPGIAQGYTMNVSLGHHKDILPGLDIQSTGRVMTCFGTSFGPKMDVIGRFSIVS
uniref:Uncharacterized protein n=1 Tax=Cacopsylla melanoneura TaxID=428564 RepID=A0A8D8PRA3_9HEMI